MPLPAVNWSADSTHAMSRGAHFSFATRTAHGLGIAAQSVCMAFAFVTASYHTGIQSAFSRTVNVPLAPSAPLEPRWAYRLACTFAQGL